VGIASLQLEIGKSKFGGVCEFATPHRSSAPMNLIEAGVDRDLVMRIGAWKTDAMLTRYNIINTDRMRAAMERGGKYVASRKKEAN
jgi:hypothetical protein